MLTTPRPDWHTIKTNETVGKYSIGFFNWVMSVPEIHRVFALHLTDRCVARFFPLEPERTERGLKFMQEEFDKYLKEKGEL